MPVASGELWQVTLNMQLLGQLFQNVLMFRERGTTVHSNAEIIGACQAFWHIYRDTISHQVQLQSMVAKRMTPVAFDSIIAPPASGEVAGTEPDDPVNPTTAMVVTLRTGVSGKTHRGRVYTPGIATGALLEYGQALTSAAQTRYQGKWSDIMALFDDATGTSLVFALGIYSRVIGGTTPHTVAGWQAVSQPVVNFILGNQRRRRLGVGV